MRRKAACACAEEKRKLRKDCAEALAANKVLAAQNDAVRRLMGELAGAVIKASHKWNDLHHRAERRRQAVRGMESE